MINADPAGNASPHDSPPWYRLPGSRRSASCCTTVAERFDIEAIRAAHPIADVAAAAGVRLRRSGSRLTGLCPFHEDRDPSLVIYPETSSYFCFACDAGGDVIHFVGRLRGTAFRETAALLAGDIGGALPPAVRAPAPRTREAPSALDPEAAAVIETAAALYVRQYRQSHEPRAYLHGRGLDDETISRLRIGFADGGLARRLRSLGFGLDSARRLGLLTGDRDTLGGRIVIPDLDARGQASWLTARSLDGREPRYLNLRLPSPLLGLAQVRRAAAPAVVLVEGPFDWLTACGWQLHAIALLGTHLSREALGALRLFGRVYLALDADGPGRRATGRIRSELGAQAVVVPLPPGVHDPSELGRHRDGRAVFLHSLHQARTREQESWLRRNDTERQRLSA